LYNASHYKADAEKKKHSRSALMLIAVLMFAESARPLNQLVFRGNNPSNE
jgi:hypothetical protein